MERGESAKEFHNKDNVKGFGEVGLGIRWRMNGTLKSLQNGAWIYRTFEIDEVTDYSDKK